MVVLGYQLLLFLFCADLSVSLQIINKTAGIPLTSFFQTKTPKYSVTDRSIADITYYSDLNMTTNNIWVTIYGTTYDSDENQTIIDNWIKSDVFDSNFSQYNSDTATNTNIRQYDDMEFMDNTVCTSPVSKDIMTCWSHAVDIIDGVIYTNIQCKLFFVKTNNFSDIINVSIVPYDQSKVYQGSALQFGLLCFNDSFFIPYLYTNDTLSNSYVYGTIIDLNGNVIYDKQELFINVSSLTPSDQFGEAKKGAVLYENKYESFIITFETLDKHINNISAAFGYYTNIDDKLFPVVIYKQSDIGHQSDPNIADGNTYLLGPFSINYNINSSITPYCCYITLYGTPGYQDRTFATFTDIYGEIINIYQPSASSNFEDISLINSSMQYYNQILDLPIISTDSTHYFMITYISYLKENSIMAAVYALSYSSPLYHLEYNGSYMMVNGSLYYEGALAYAGYTFPYSNELFFVWSAYSGDNGEDKLIYGQTFGIYSK